MAPLSMRPCGPSPAPPASHAAMCARRGAQPARVCGQPARRAARAAACRLPPPPCAALHAAASRSRCRRPTVRPETSASARCGSAVQVTALPRKREAERRAPGFPGLLPAPSAARAGPRAPDAPPRGTAPIADHPCAAPGG